MASLLKAGLSPEEVADYFNSQGNGYLTKDAVRSKMYRVGYSSNGKAIKNKEQRVPYVDVSQLEKELLNIQGQSNGNETDFHTNEGWHTANSLTRAQHLSMNMGEHLAHKDTQPNPLDSPAEKSEESLMANLVDQIRENNHKSDTLFADSNRVNDRPVSKAIKSVSNTSEGSKVDVECLFDTKQQFTPDEMLEMAGLSAADFNLKQVKGAKWSVVSTEFGRKWNFYASVLATPKTGNLVAMIEAINAQVVPTYFEPEYARPDRNLVIPLPDLHFGWTTYEDIQDKVAQLQGIIESGYDTIVFEQLGDLFHSDQMHTTQTVRGTQLDQVDMRQAFNDASHFFNDLIPVALQNANHVRYYSVFGNHSGDLEYAFGLGLKARYPQVKVDLNDDNPASDWRTAYQLGHVGIMLAHGDMARNRLTGLFPTEYKKIWGNSITAELHSGHFHTERFKDDNGIMWRQLGTPKPNDPYEIRNGYTSAKHLMYAFEYDDTRLRVSYEL